MEINEPARQKTLHVPYLIGLCSKSFSICWTDVRVGDIK